MTREPLIGLEIFVTFIIKHTPSLFYFWSPTFFTFRIFGDIMEINAIRLASPFWGLYTIVVFIYELVSNCLRHVKSHLVLSLTNYWPTAFVHCAHGQGHGVSRILIKTCLGTYWQHRCIANETQWWLPVRLRLTRHTRMPLAYINENHVFQRK